MLLLLLLLLLLLDAVRSTASCVLLVYEALSY
jgi:hypothetical protein